jgi:hypothetical protein
MLVEEIDREFASFPVPLNVQTLKHYCGALKSLGF